MSEYSIQSKIILYVRVQYSIKNHTIRPSKVFNQKSYCMSEWSINSKSYYMFEYSIQSKSYCTSECSINQKSYYTSECSILSKIILYIRVQYKIKHHTIRPSIVFYQKFVLYVRMQCILPKIHMVRLSAMHHSFNTTQ